MDGDEGAVQDGVEPGEAAGVLERRLQAKPGHDPQDAIAKGDREVFR